MAFTPPDGRVYRAQLMKEQPLCLGWGEGDPAWDALPAEPRREDFATLEDWRAAHTQWQQLVLYKTQPPYALLSPVGFRLSSSVMFVVPDAAGEIVTPQGNYTVSGDDYPTRFLCGVFRFDFSEAADASIREIGVFAGTVPKAGLPRGRRYFLPEQIEHPGRMQLLDRFPKFPRSPSMRQTIEAVMTF